MIRRTFYVSVAFLCLGIANLCGQIKHQVSFTSEYIISKVENENGSSYSRINIPGLYMTDSIGYPALPVKYVKLIIPSNANATDITIDKAEGKKLSLNNIIEPVQPPIPTKIGAQKQNFVEPPTGTFTGQWLAYEFENPVTIMAYSITPETGTHISRAPRNWLLQAWDGSSWQTLDTRSNYTTTSWESQNSQQFTVQYPKKYTKYRLYVQQVNGSDVVSIRKFKIFGMGSSTVTLKSSMISGTETTPLIDIDEIVSPEMEVSPNPNNGNFTIKLFGVENVKGEQCNTDSLSYADALKSGRNVDYIFGQIVLIEIFDLKGKKVYSTITKEDILDINLSSLGHGIYIVKAIINNKKVITKKVVVE